MNEKLTKIEAHYDPTKDLYPYLSIQYERETEAGRTLVDIPKAFLSLTPDHCRIKVDNLHCYSTTDASYSTTDASYYIELLSDKLDLAEAKGEVSDVKYKYAEKILEKYTRKMTVAEIEKILGYPIEIVSAK